MGQNLYFESTILLLRNVHEVMKHNLQSKQPDTLRQAITVHVACPLFSDFKNYQVMSPEEVRILESSRNRQEER